MFTRTVREKEAFEAVQFSRGEAQLLPLKYGPVLSRYARRHARKMSERESLFHTEDMATVLRTYGIAWSMWGENVGVTGLTVGSLHTAFMRSAGHRANILNPKYRRAGIGVYVDAEGRLWETQVFIR